MISATRPRVLFAIGVIALGAAYLLYSDYHRYMRTVPPTDRICGIWVIDPERTTWREARNLIQRGVIDPSQGYLEISRPDKFVISDLPDFSFEAPWKIALHLSGSGTWRTDIDVQGFAYLWLDFREVDGKPTEEIRATAVFRREGAEYFLHAIIKDPDSGDTLVLRRNGKGTENKRRKTEKGSRTEANEKRVGTILRNGKGGTTIYWAEE